MLQPNKSPQQRWTNASDPGSDFLHVVGPGNTVVGGIDSSGAPQGVLTASGNLLIPNSALMLGGSTKSVAAKAVMVTPGATVTFLNVSGTGGGRVGSIWLGINGQNVGSSTVSLSDSNSTLSIVCDGQTVYNDRVVLYFGAEYLWYTYTFTGKYLAGNADATPTTMGLMSKIPVPFTDSCSISYTNNSGQVQHIYYTISYTVNVPNVWNRNRRLLTKSGVFTYTTQQATFTANNPSISATNAFYSGQQVSFSTSGTLPAGISANTLYYVISTGLSGTTFEVSATLGGTAITPTTSGSGTIFVNSLINSRNTTPASVVSTFTANNPSISASNSFNPGQPVVFTSTGTLPAGINANQVLYVIATGLSSTTFQVSATVNGTAITPTTAGTGTISANTWSVLTYAPIASVGSPITLVNDAGLNPGQFLGIAFGIDNNNASPIDAPYEGQFKIYVDGNSSPNYMSSGTEDYIGLSFYWAGLKSSQGSLNQPENSFPNAVSDEYGVVFYQKIVVNGNVLVTNCYRFHLSDPIPFSNAIKVTWDAGEPSASAGQDWTGTTRFAYCLYYYTN